MNMNNHDRMISIKKDVPREKIGKVLKTLSSSVEIVDTSVKVKNNRRFKK